MPHSTDSPGEAPPQDLELPDAPPSAEEKEANGDSTPVKQERVPSSSPPPAIPADAEDAAKNESSNDLENLFDDDDDDGDDDPSKEPAAATKQETPTDAVQKSVDSDSDEDLLGDTNDEDLLAAEQSVASASYTDPGVMLAFYQRLFPWRLLFQWLNHSPVPSADFTHREFAFTLSNAAYLRYQSFATFEQLRKDVLRLNPTRFEIGPVYSANPRDRKTLRKAAFRPVAKEFVIDIDLTDYDDVRTCCAKASICRRCWRFVTAAIRVLDVALRDDLGFAHVLWVYSGRRGAHAWVCDRRARAMDDAKRRAVASYLEVIKGGANQAKKVNVRRPLHPHVARSLDVLRTRFAEEILQDQDPWRSKAGAEKLLGLLPDRALNEALRKKWESSASERSSAEKWADIDAVARTGISETVNPQTLREHKQDVVLEYMYPRLDVEVSKHLNHLLKSPFVVHPGTGRVCVPIDARRPESFAPDEVPTVTELLAEIDAWDGGQRENGEGRKRESGEGETQDWEKTRLRPYVEVFRRFVGGLVKEEAPLKRQRSDEERSGSKMEF